MEDAAPHKRRKRGRKPVNLEARYRRETNLSREVENAMDDEARHERYREWVLKQDANLLCLAAAHADGHLYLKLSDYACGCAVSDIDFMPECDGRTPGCRLSARKRATEV